MILWRGVVLWDSLGGNHLRSQGRNGREGGECVVLVLHLVSPCTLDIQGQRGGGQEGHLGELPKGIGGKTSPPLFWCWAWMFGTFWQQRISNHVKGLLEVDKSNPRLVTVFFSYLQGRFQIEYCVDAAFFLKAAACLVYAIATKEGFIRFAMMAAITL